MTITDRDSKGRIKKGGKVLTSEQASIQGKMPKGKKEKSASRDQLLKESGYDDPDSAPESKKLLAEEASKGSVPAINKFLGKQEEITQSATLMQPGDFCPSCHQYVIRELQLDEDQLDSILESIDHIRRNQGKKKIPLVIEGPDIDTGNTQ